MNPVQQKIHIFQLETKWQNRKYDSVFVKSPVLSGDDGMNWKGIDS